MRKLLFVFVLGLVGCGGMFGQLPPAGHSAQLSWQVPAPNATWAGCVVGQPSCGFVLSYIDLPSGTSTCPTPVINSSGVGNYTPLNQANPATGTTYSDVSAAGKTRCYLAQTVQGNGVSNPSNLAGPVTVLGNPTSPTMGPATTAQNVVPNNPVKPALTDSYQVASLTPRLSLKVSAL